MLAPLPQGDLGGLQEHPCTGDSGTLDPQHFPPEDFTSGHSFSVLRCNAEQSLVVILQHHGQNSSPAGADGCDVFLVYSLVSFTVGEGGLWVLSGVKELKYLFLLFPLSHVLNHFQAMVGFALKFVE